MADATLLSWITAEVDQALAQVREKIARCTTAPEGGGSLQGCPEHLHQVSGALRMVGLAGATRFCEELEGSFQRLNGAPSANALEVIDRAVLTLKDFVGDVSRGGADTPQRLLTVYRDLSSLRGAEVTEKDLFFPDLSPEPPEPQQPLQLAEDALCAFLLGHRARFQRGLLSTLRDQAGGIEDMRVALEALHQASRLLPEPRAIAWVGLGLLDALDGTRDKAWAAAAKSLCNRIDFHIRDLATGSRRVNDGLLREALYALATSGHLTPRIRAIRQLYQLDSHLSEAVAAPSQVHDIADVGPVLQDLRSRLEGMKSAWLQYLSGEPNAMLPLRELLAAFKARAAQVGNRQLSRLVDAIALVAARLPDPYPQGTSFMVMEMASAFLLVERVLESLSEPPEDLEEQIGIMGGWLLDAAEGKSTGEPPAGLRPDLTQQIGTLQLRAQVAKEVMGNLQHIEQVLDAFARDATRRDELDSLGPHLRQIHGAFTVLGLERAAELLATCETLIAALAAADHAQAAEDMDWIAEGLSIIGMYLEPCLRGREPSEAIVARFLERYDARPPIVRSPLPGSDARGSDTGPSGAVARPGVDGELLGIYIEEAGEVVAGIAAAQEAVRARPDDREALTTIRRGFHTLKGSGRMVGLMDVGEAAWEIEQAMNRWLERGAPASPRLQELIEKGRASFAAWLEGLKDGSLAAEVDSSGIAAAAAALASDDQPLPAPSLVDIYRGEAAQHVASLAHELAAWRLGSEASFEFTRAAHTLASSSLTAGYPAIAALAAALEKWLPLAQRVTEAADCALVEAVLARLKSMVEAVANGEEPGDSEGERAALEALSCRLEAPPAHEPQARPEPAKAFERPEPTAAPRPDKRVMRDDIDPQLLSIFLEEAQELLPQIGSDLRDWKAAPADSRISQSLRRALHTLKGSARMAGAIRLGELAHLMESRVEAAIASGALPPEAFSDLEEKMDRLSLDLERMRGGGRMARPAAFDPAPLAAQPAAAAQRAEAPLPNPAALLRVNAETLDQLINGSGEISIARSRVEAELRLLKQSLSDLNDSVARLRSQLREVEVQADSQMQSRQSVMEERSREFDPLEFDRYTRLQELTRLMAESVHDVVTIQQTLARNLGEADAGLLQQARITRTMQDELMRMRAVPFSNLSERLFRVVRQAARELGKKAELELEGGQVELDRSALERIAAPLEHMLRNALAHGIEAPAIRRAAGKPDGGRISIALRQEANEIALVLSDDGVGLDLEALRRKGVEHGLVQPGQDLSEAELIQLIFASGLSTAENVSELAGRGVGMDVVRNEIAAIGGRIDITTRRGRGTSFAIYLPLTLAVTQAVLVRAGGRVLAISSATVEQVLRLKVDSMRSLYEHGAVEFQGRMYPLRSLDQLLGGTQAVNVQAYNSVLLLRSGIQRVAVHVDELIGNQEIVVKAIGPQLSRLRGVAGATVLADGTIVLIINPVQLAQRARTAAPASVEASAVAEASRIMVVDDSLTVRRITSRLLEREGYRVTTAKDGLDALEQMKEQLPDIMLVDIEMPRMDGFDLAKNVRGDPRSAAIPIIVISSRTAEKHRNQAARLGVNAFLGKPYQDAELLEQVSRYAHK